MGRTSLRSRLGAVTIVLAVIAAPLALGATAASAAPIPPEITSPTEGSYVAPTDQIVITGGSATPGYGVEVVVDDGFACFTESAEDGSWSCQTEAGIADGAHTVVARQTVDEELTGTVVNYTIGVAPEPPAETPVDPPVETPVDPPVDVPVETPVETPADPAIETPAETPAELPAGLPTQVPAATPAETPAAIDAPSSAPTSITPPRNLAPVVTPRAALNWTLSVGGVTGPIRPGQTVTLSSSGLPAGSTVSAELHSTPIALGSTTVGSDGTFTIAALIPLTVETGDHHFVVAVTEPGETASVTETAVTIDRPDIVAVSADAAESTDDTVTATANALSARSAAVAVDRDAPGAANSLSTSIAPAWEVLSSPLAIGTSVIAGLAFLVLVAFPSELLGAAIQRRYTGLHRVGRVLPPGVGAWFARHPVVSGVGAIALATLITGFSDPAFGGDVASVRLLIACFIAAIIVSYATYALLGWFLNRRWSLPTSLNLRPFTLIITVVGVVLSRVLDFSPGFLFGMMLSLTFPATASVAMRSHARLLRTCLIVTIAIVSWFVYSGMIAVTGGAPTDFGSALLQDTLAALSTEGLTGMLIGMLPFLYLDGRDIWRHSKRSWAVVYALVVVVFFVVVAPKPTNWADLGDKYGPWAVVLGAYAVIALAAYFALHRSELRVAARAVRQDA